MDLPNPRHYDGRLRRSAMTEIEKKPLCPDRLRKITGSFAFIEHRFLRDGFWTSLSHHELLLYVFLVLVADRNGLSYYSFDKTCSLLKISIDEYIFARNALIDKDLIAFDGHLYQVLSLPCKPLAQPERLLKDLKDMEDKDPATIRRLIHKSLGVSHD
jgi:hypothetical protein